jgi:hypothetical protein
MDGAYVIQIIALDNAGHNKESGGVWNGVMCKFLFVVTRSDASLEGLLFSSKYIVAGWEKPPAIGHD